MRQRRVSFVDTRDVAAVASRVLVDPDAHPAGPRTLTGPQALDFSQVALLLSSELGRRVSYEPCGLMTATQEPLSRVPIRRSSGCSS
jgi:uncharacterized protein YbjT (DUF2867 family)